MEYYYWTRQFSYYIGVTFEDRNDTGYFQVHNRSEMYMITTNQSTIHYTNAYYTNFRHGILYDGLAYFNEIDRNLLVQSYITITREQDCLSAYDNFKMVFNLRGSNPKKTKSFSIDNMIDFNGPCVYFMVTQRIFQIDFGDFPQCEVVLSYRMVVRNSTRRNRDICSDKFFKV